MIYSKILNYIENETEPKNLYQNIKTMLTNCRDSQYPQDYQIKDIQRKADSKYAQLTKTETKKEIESDLKEILKKLEKVDDKFYTMLYMTKCTNTETKDYNTLTTIILQLKKIINK